MMDDRIVERRTDRDDPATDVNRPGWDPRDQEDDHVTRPEPIDDRSRWGSPQSAPGAPDTGEVEVDARPAGDSEGAVGAAVVGGAGGAIAGGAVAGPPGALVGGVLGAAAGYASGGSTDRGVASRD